MKFLTNENVPIASVNYLKSKGFDITSMGIEYQGTANEGVMKLAMEQDRTIINYDSDYGERIFKHGFKPNAGVIFIRQQPTESLETARIIDRITTTPDLTFERTLTVVDLNSSRQKEY